MQTLYQLGGGFVDATVVGHHELREILHLPGLGMFQREVPGIHVDLIRRDDNGSDLRIGGSRTLRHGCGCGCEKAEGYWIKEFHSAFL
jgi:hypothetical protein